MQYPNHLITRNETDSALITAIQQQLNTFGCGPVTINGIFSAETFRAIKLFQTRHLDQNGTPLVIDGKIGPATWAVLFGAANVPASTVAPSPLLAKAIEVAVSQIGKVENPLGSNRGPEVDEYLRAAGLDPEGQHYSWCMAFVYWCFKQSALALNQNNPLIKTAGCLDHWYRATCPEILTADAVQNPSLVKPGHIFIIDHGKGAGHTGIVESVNGLFLTTIEGNTNTALSSNGYGVFRLERRKISDINKGFLNYA